MYVATIEKKNSIQCRRQKLIFPQCLKIAKKVSHTIFCVIKNANFFPLWPISYLLESNGKLVFILWLKENRKLGSDNEWNEQKNSSADWTFARSYVLVANCTRENGQKMRINALCAMINWSSFPVVMQEF